MKIEIKKVDEDRGIVQITCPDERWYSVRPLLGDDVKSISQEDFYPSSSWIARYYPKGVEYIRWVANKGWDIAEEVKQEAAEKGTRIHRACEFLLLGGDITHDMEFNDSEGNSDQLNAEEYYAVMTFKRFLDEQKPFVLAQGNGNPAIEYTILNHEHKFAGTVDFKCRIAQDNYENVWIIDIKTSKEIYPSHEIQLSSYLETDKEAIKQAILQVGYKKNKAGYKLTEIEPQFDVFLAAKRIWQKEQGKILVPQREYPLKITWEPLKEVPKAETKTKK